jgi:hypothetical protein
MQSARDAQRAEILAELNGQTSVQASTASRPAEGSDQPLRDQIRAAVAKLK